MLAADAIPVIGPIVFTVPGVAESNDTRRLSSVSPKTWSAEAAASGMAAPIDAARVRTRFVRTDIVFSFWSSCGGYPASARMRTGRLRAMTGGNRDGRSKVCERRPETVFASEGEFGIMAAFEVPVRWKGERPGPAPLHHRTHARGRGVRRLADPVRPARSAHRRPPYLPPM